MTLFEFSRNFAPLLIFGRSIYQGCHALTFALAGLSCFGAAGQVMTKIASDGGWVLGMTSVDDDLFVLLDRRDHQVAVYSINDFRLQRHLNLPEVQPRDHQVAVYSINDFRLQRHLNLPEVQPRDHQVAVYSITDFRLQRHLNLPEV